MPYSMIIQTTGIVNAVPRIKAVNFIVLPMNLPVFPRRDVAAVTTGGRRALSLPVPSGPPPLRDSRFGVFVDSIFSQFRIFDKIYEFL